MLLVNYFTFNYFALCTLMFVAICCRIYYQYDKILKKTPRLAPSLCWKGIFAF